MRLCHGLHLIWFVSLRASPPPSPAPRAGASAHLRRHAAAARRRDAVPLAQPPRPTAPCRPPRPRMAGTLAHPSSTHRPGRPVAPPEPAFHHVLLKTPYLRAEWPVL